MSGYWMRLEKDFMTKYYIRHIRNERYGNDKFALYMTMLTESIDHDGELRSAEGLAFTPEKLTMLAFGDCIKSESTAREIGKAIKHYNEVVTSGLELFETLNLIETHPDGTILMTKLADKIGTTSKDRTREYRERKKHEPESQPSHSDVTSDKAGDKIGDEVKDKVKETDKETMIKKSELEKTTRYFTKPSIEDVEKYVKEKGYVMDPKKFHAYQTSKSWRVGNSKMTDWKSSVDVWELREKTYIEEKKKGSKPDVEIDWLDDYLKNSK